MNARSGALRALPEEESRAALKMQELIAAHCLEAERFAYLLTGDRELARDIAQDAFVRLLSRFRNRTSPEGFGAYLRSTIVNLVRDHWRRRRTAAMYAVMLWHKEEPVEPFPAVDQRDELWESLQVLPVRQRAVLVLRYYEDLSEAQVAVVLGCSVGAVKGLVTRATQAMRERLEEE